MIRGVFMFRCLASSLLLLIGMGHPAQGQLPRVRAEVVGMSSERLARIPVALRDFVDRGQVAGVVTLVARRGRIVALDSAGLQDMATRSPMRTSTIFRIASMTKPVTSVAVMILLEEGKLRLDDPASKFLPEFAESRVLVGGSGSTGKSDSLVRSERAVTIRDLLTHRSGLIYGALDTTRLGSRYRGAGIQDGLQAKRGTTAAENVRRLGGQPLAFQPGSPWRYGLSTDVLGALVEKVRDVAGAVLRAAHLRAASDEGHGVSRTRREARPSRLHLHHAQRLVGGHGGQRRLPRWPSQSR
jgi:CubicO group peptidase (beta-lactamase class C family)